MKTCKLCGKEFFSLSRFSYHISKTHDIECKKYYKDYILSEGDNNGICQNENCEKITVFEGMGKGFRGFCSLKCSTGSKKIRDKIEKTCKKRYGHTHHLKLKEILDKQKNTNLEKYGFNCILQNEEIKQNIKNTNIEKYGFENPMCSDEIKDKTKQTNLERYGCEYTFQSKEIREKSKQTNLERYGVEFSSQREDIKDKIRKTFLDKYGVEHALQVDEFKEKQENTCLQKFGYKHPSKNEEIKQKTKKLYLKIHYQKLFNSDRLQNLVTPLFTEEEYTGTKIDEKYKFKCVKCENEFEDRLINGRIPRCKTCYPISGSSKVEKSIIEYVKSLLPKENIIENDRKILNGKELDIYIPSKKIAIELNGIYWHSELNGKDKNYHLSKTIECEKLGIQLIHIFEDEWYEKQEIIKSIIKNKFGLTKERIFARKCEIKNVQKDESDIFLNNNHLQGNVNGKSLGLFYKDELVSILTYGKPRFNKNYESEILRFCNKLDTIVIGGLSKLIKYYLNNKNYKSIISYADRRFGKGNVYLKCGFEKVGESKPSYYYVKGWSRFNRMKFQKHKLQNKLEIFVEELTEWENMQLNDYDRIWDCGNIKYSIKL